jgi:hypothetical protein
MWGFIPLKPKRISSTMARLKSCPDTNPGFPRDQPRDTGDANVLVIIIIAGNHSRVRRKPVCSEALKWQKWAGRTILI